MRDESEALLAIADQQQAGCLEKIATISFVIYPGGLDRPD
jgi:hypothetical protein